MIKRDLSIVGSEFLDFYKIGDVVRFCGDDFGESIELKTGIILDICNLSLSDGIFSHAEIYVMGYDRLELVLLGNLTLLYKV